MKTGIDPAVDCVFKWLFGSEDNKALSISLINAILEDSGENKIVELELLNPYNPQEFLGDKLSIVDVKAKNELGEWFLIEIQIQMSEYFPKRLLYYWARMYQSQLQKGENYDLLKRVTLICVTKDPLPISTRHYHSQFKVMEVRNQFSLCEDCQIHTVELAKFLNTIEALDKPIERWTYFLKHGEQLDEENLPAPLKVPELQRAVKELTMFTREERERELYESRRKAIMDERSRLAEQYKKGEQIGLQKGEQIGLQKGEQIGLQKGEQIGLQKGEQIGLQKTIVNALKLNWDLQAIHEITGISIAEIEKIREDLEKS